MVRLKEISSKIIRLFFPIKKNMKGWSLIEDKNGPFGEFLSCINWQRFSDGSYGHRFILYPNNKNWSKPDFWNLIDYSTDKIYKIRNRFQLNKLIPISYDKEIINV